MYHTKKVKDVKPPKGWQFSGDPSFLKLTNHNYDILFRVVNIRIEAAVVTGIHSRPEGSNEWKVEECHGQTGIKIQRETNLSNNEAKELAVKLARDLNRNKFWDTLIWVIMAALLAAVFSLILQKVFD
jgi:hypothetical protein